MTVLTSLLRRWGATDSALPIAVVALLYVLTLGGLERGGLWQIDNANKLLQLQGILHSGGEDFSLPWPGKSLDPSIEYNPIPYLFSRVEDGKLYSVFSPVFALVSTVPYALAGMTGLYVLPVLASLIMLVGIGRLAHLIALDEITPLPSVQRHAAILLAGLCTPIWFYSVVFWEHTIAVCLCVWSIYYVLEYRRRRGQSLLAKAAVLAAMSAYFRDELYIFCVVIAVAAAWVAENGKVRVGVTTLGLSIASVVPLWAFQWYVTGHPFGFHLGSHLLTVAGVFDHLSTRPQVIFNLLLSSTPIPVISILIAIPFAAALFRRPSESEGTNTEARIFAAALVGAGVSLVGYHFFDSPIGYMLHSSNSLFTVAPFVILGLLRRRADASSESVVDTGYFIRVVALGFVTLYVLAAPEFGSRGIHWGNRYLLLLYALGAALAAGKIVETFGATPAARGRSGRVLVIALIALSFGAQLFSLRLLDQKKELSYRLNEAMRDRPEEIVVTTLRWAPQELFASFYDKIFLYADSPAALGRITDWLIATGQRRYLLVAQPSPEAGPSTVVLKDADLGFFSLTLTPKSL
jgi:hypothetical protein